MEPASSDEFATGAYAGSRASSSDLFAPPPVTHAGRGEVAVPSDVWPEPTADDQEIMAAVQAEAGAIEDLLLALIEAPTTLGNEALGQEVMRQAFREVGLEPVDVPMDAEALRADPAAAPFDWDISGETNVVATWHPATDGGRSLILNGHIDVVPPEPVDQWHTPPFMAVRDGNWIYGRGAADMKCGLAAIVGAVRGLKRLGVTPRAPVHLQSVVEEECTGNGTLACLRAGYAADAAIVAEPFGSAITTSQVGVMWFDVVIRGIAAHAAEENGGVNAIEKSFHIIRQLRHLESELNVTPPAPYDRFSHPINLNVGEIRGGEWPSTVPSECVTSFRIALYPGMRVRDMRDRIEGAVAQAAAEDPLVFAHPPEVRYRGFSCEGYSIENDSRLVASLAAAFVRQSGEAPSLVATTGTTDAGVLGLQGGIPAVCFGPYAEQAHGVDERVYFPSVVQTAQVMASFVRDWCGLSG